MEAIRREKLKALLEQALALPPEQRAAFLDEACTGDTALRDELDSLLDHAEEAFAFFDSLAGAVLPQAQQQAPSPKKADGDPLGLIGRMVSHYQILEKIGGGGMGVVYKAHDTRLERPVALKFLPPHLSTDDESNARFVREAQAASALDHTNICTIHDIGQTDEGQFFIAMAYYQGETLKKKIARGALPINEALDYAVQMAEGLSRAHEAGIVHRDIKPANVMVTKDGVVKIVDFGLAKLTGAVELTKTGMTLGTLVYMSPEQIHGDVVDHRTDIWSWGVVVYEMLTGERPFKGHYEQALVYSILNESPLPPTEIRDEIPGDIGRITLKGLRKDRGDRYGSVGQLLWDLKAVQRALEGKQPAGLVAEKPAPKKETERRQATVLFATIAGYAEMLERMDPEEVAAVLNRSVALFGSVAQQYGGTMDQVMGPCIRVLFGVPVALEQAPQKAIHAAIAMRKRLHQEHRAQQLPVSLDLEIGINTGMVIAGALGTAQEYTVMGETVELASQLMEHCAEGQIYVGPSTYRYTRRAFDFTEHKPMTVKGRKAPVAVYALLSERAEVHQPQLGTERMIHSEMVGRDRELDRLKLHVLKVINGEGSIVSVIGEAGIGKSRLIAELRKIEDLKKVNLLKGRALSLGKNLSYHPLLDVLKKWAGITEEDTAAASTAKLERAIERIHPEGVAEVFPFIATLMGMKLTGAPAERVKGIEGEALEKLILKNMRELMVHGAAHRPTVLILEDLHWADLSSIELLESLYRLAEGHQILFVNVLRPNYEETGERLLQTIRERYDRSHAELYVEPLGASQCEVLIQNLLNAGTLPSGIRATVADRAGGNPFFIEEVMRSFIDEGAVAFREGTFTVSEKIDAVVIPNTIQDVLLARIDRLDEETRQLLKKASVIGRYFFYRILNEVAQNMEHLDDHLDGLKGVQLILESRRTDELEYLFKHVLVQEVTYESILHKKRKALHLQVAEAIESVFSERLPEFYGMLALHYSQGEHLEKAEAYLIKAGEEASRAAASSEALNYYQEALKIYLNKSGEAVDSEKVAMLEKNIALAFLNKGLMAEAVPHFDKVLELWGERTHLNHPLLALLVHLPFIIWILFLSPNRKTKKPSSKDNEFINLYERRTTALVSVDTKRMFIDSLRIIRWINKFEIKEIENGAGLYAATGTVFSATGYSFLLGGKIIELAKTQLDKNDIRSTATLPSIELVHNSLSGRWTKDLKYDERLINRCLDIGEFYWGGVLTFWTGLLQIERGFFLDSEKCVDKLHETAEIYEHHNTMVRKYVLNARLLVKQRSLQQALKEIEHGLVMAQKLRQDFYAFWIFGLQPYIQVLLNDFEAAKRSLAKARELIAHKERTLPVYLSGFMMSQFLLDVSLLEQAFVSSHQPNISPLRRQAFRSGKAAVKNAARYAVDKTEAFKLMGVYYWLIGKQKKALKWWVKSIRIGEHLGARLELARTYMEVGKRLLEPKSKHGALNGLSAEDYLGKARALFEEMELAWDVQELEKILPDEGKNT